MLDSESLLRLYNNVLDTDMVHYNIPEEAIWIGITSMTEVYKPKGGLSAPRSTVADFNDLAHRAAYLFKYAALHTALVRDMLYEAINLNFSFFRHLVFASDNFKICSLGGGPGSDVIGALIALHSFFSYFRVSVSVIDYMDNWCYSFNSILKELGTGFYGAFGNNISHLLQWRYVGANLLKPLTDEVMYEINSASLVTMIKFVSAASCKDTESMVKNIFTAMKPGAVLLFIDNDGGGFREIILRAAQMFNFNSVFGPVHHENYVNEIVRNKRFGVVSCHKTTVSVYVLQKPLPQPRDSLLGRFPYEAAGTPLHPRYQDENLCSNQNYSPMQTALTPCIFQLNSSVNPDIPSTPLRSEIVDCQNNDPQSPPIFSFQPSTPLSLNQSRNSMGNGCLPLPRLKRVHNRLAKKMNKIKSRAFSVIQKKYRERRNGKSHCVSRL